MFDTKNKMKITYFTQVNNTQLTFTRSKLTIETLEKGVKYVQSEQ